MLSIWSESTVITFPKDVVELTFENPIDKLVDGFELFAETGSSDLLHPPIAIVIMIITVAIEKNFCCFMYVPLYS